MKKVMIVDDEKKIREVYSKILKAEGLEVTEAANAQQVIEGLLSDKVDLVLLDINIPMFNGKDIYEGIREYDPSIKVIVSSVYSEDKQKHMIPKAEGYFDKAEGPSVLLNRINTVLAEKENPDNLFESDTGSSN